MTGSDLDEIVIDRLRSFEQRYTTGRRRIFDALRAADGPLTIPQILDQDDRLSQSSVYRNLSILEEVGVVSRIVTADDFARYELAEDLTEHHHHLICSRCGDVIDFALPEGVEVALEHALDAIAAGQGFAVEGHRLDLLGVCSRCQEDKT